MNPIVRASLLLFLFFSFAPAQAGLLPKVFSPEEAFHYLQGSRAYLRDMPLLPIYGRRMKPAAYLGMFRRESGMATHVFIRKKNYPNFDMIRIRLLRPLFEDARIATENIPRPTTYPGQIAMRTSRALRDSGLLLEADRIVGELTERGLVSVIPEGERGLVALGAANEGLPPFSRELLLDLRNPETALPTSGSSDLHYSFSFPGQPFAAAAAEIRIGMRKHETPEVINEVLSVVRESLTREF